MLVLNFSQQITNPLSNSQDICSFLYHKALTSHTDKSAWLEAQVRQLLQIVNQQPSRLDLRSLLDAVDSVKQRVTQLEASDQRLGTCAGGSPVPSHDFPVSACICGRG